MAAPWIVGFLVFTLGPMLVSLYLSFTEWDLFTAPSFIGFENYIELIRYDDVFHEAIYNTLYYSLISVPLGMLLSLMFAYLLNKPLRGMRFFRTAIYLPALVPVVATTLVFSWMFAPTAGLINQALAFFGIIGPAWLLSEVWVKPALIIMSLWGVGGGIVLLLAGMRGIPEELYEAASLDGASSFYQFWRITVPMLSPVIFFNLVMSVIGSLQTFTQVYLLTSGGPDDASTMIVPYLFDNGFRYYDMGYASAIAWLLFLMVLVFTALVFRSSPMWVYYESEVKG